ncbi:hypothetical protein V1520DRAFT_334852 [Lipomyces starkeyi]|uniref:Ubiquitin-activating enzyme E1-like n=1 Tax=Lipomyces starkeyi NRRL Y-11557 TaxID=675824 RepID=A0A1E3PY08_LIPST|nr:hypothetical protein LIPSTDRAFT_74599 [Lipomyces starkeyi NRRL Y-11557]
MSRETYVTEAIGDVYQRIKTARVLMVGAGGIGCELLKNLVLTGYGEVHLVDLDTIDLSNLNRQFLFGHEHIKKSKALVAKDTASKFNPHVKLVAHHANIKDPQFSVTWFKSFDLVFNALDNLDARRYVNRMCLTAEVPLIESGTTGFNGQVQVIVKGKTECYDCNPKEVPKTFPVCTIRTTPSQPIHCIVWAKSYLFSNIFGIDEDESPDLDNSVNADNASEIDNLKRENTELKHIKDAFGTSEFPRLVFEKVFKIDIDRLLSMEDAWKHRKAPVPILYDELQLVADAEVKKSAAKVAADDQPVWSLAEDFVVFKDSVERLSARVLELQKNMPEGSARPVLSFDKDDDETLDFVVAAANLRSQVFGIERKSKFEIKQMAGNIIPAIATTNAIIAGICVLQSFKILNNDLAHAKAVFLSRQPERIFSTESLQPPNPDCAVCSVARCSIEVDVDRLTLGNFVERILRGELGYSDELSIVTNKLLYDLEFDDNVYKTFKELDVGDGTFVTIIDEEEPEGSTPRVNLEFLVYAKESTDDMDSSYKLTYIPEIPRRPMPKRIELAKEEGVVEAVPFGIGNGSVLAGQKRKAEDDELVEVSSMDAKKSKVQTGDEDVIVLDDDEAIEID